MVSAEIHPHAGLSRGDKVRTDRRRFITASLAGSALSLTAGSAAARIAGNPPGIGAVAFDGFTTFDPRPIFTLASELFPGKGTELGNAWRTRQFEYTWLRTLTGRYVDFWQVTEEALAFSTQLLGLELNADARRRLMQAYLDLRAWPDALPAFRALHQAGLKLAFLSNFTAPMLDAATRNSGLQDLVGEPLTTDRVRAYKPDPRAYQMGVDSFGLPRESIVFAAFGGWDAAGAKSFGYPTFWVNRFKLPVEQLGVVPDGTGAGLDDLVRFVLARQAGAVTPS